jgi:2'-5' RNA ligase
VRLFVALDIPEEVRTALGALVEKLRPACRNARWVRMDGAHLTLKFIGEIPAEKAEDIKTALAAVPFASPIKISFRGLGFFPSERRPRVFWAGMEASDELGALVAAVETALEPLGIAREQRAFSPHLTLARFDSPSDHRHLHAAIAAADGPLEFGGTIAKEFHLYQSVLKQGGAEYTRLATFQSSGGESR